MPDRPPIDYTTIPSYIQINWMHRDCAIKSGTVILGVFVTGVLALPYGLTYVARYVRLQAEHRWAFSTVASACIAYYAGVRSKKECERKIVDLLKKELSEKQQLK